MVNWSFKHRADDKRRARRENAIPHPFLTNVQKLEKQLSELDVTEAKRSLNRKESEPRDNSVEVTLKILRRNKQIIHRMVPCDKDASDLTLYGGPRLTRLPERMLVSNSLSDPVLFCFTRYFVAVGGTDCLSTRAGCG